MDTGYPDPSLRDRVHGDQSLDGFIQVGKRCADDIAKALAVIGRPLANFKNALDFGCGSARILRWLHEANPDLKLSGSDIDAQAIDWCKKAFPSLEFSVNPGMPPSNFKDAQFDLIYVVSVFTHLNEEFQDAWMAELRRILSPSGILIITLHGEHALKKHPQHRQKGLGPTGFCYLPEAHWHKYFPTWYGTTYHSEAYVRSHFLRWFEIVSFSKAGLGDFQDLAILAPAKGN